MKYKVILFDLDDTLTDPQEGICKSINHAISFFGAEEKPSAIQEEKKPLLNIIGKLNASFPKYCLNYHLKELV